MKVAEKRRRHYITHVSGKDYETFKISGDEFEESARINFVKGNFLDAALEHKNAAKCYKEAFERSEEDSSLREKMHALYTGASLASKKAHRMAALYKATEKKPLLIRGLIRKIKGDQILGLFIFAILFSSPSITGSLIGEQEIVSFTGIMLFFIALIASYFFVMKEFLISRHLDQY